LLLFGIAAHDYALSLGVNALAAGTTRHLLVVHHLDGFAEADRSADYDTTSWEVDSIREGARAYDHQQAALFEVVLDYLAFLDG